MPIKKQTLIALLSCVIVACAALPADRAGIWPGPTPPSTDEVIDYVRTHWASYSERTSRLQQRQNQEATLIGVRDVSCGPYYGVPECSFTVTVSFGGGSAVDQRLSSQFDRSADGRLFETMVLVHERRR